jgi:hypothetical protein
MKKLYREAWKACPPNIQQEIDHALETAAEGRKVTAKFEARYLIADDYLDGQHAQYREAIKERLQWPATVQAWEEEREQQEQQHKQEQEQRRREYWTPERVAERNLKRQQHEEQRLRKAAQMAATAGENGFDTYSRTSCRQCGKPLTDPVSKLRGIGPECWAHIVSFGITHGILSEHNELYPGWLKQDVERAIKHRQNEQRRRDTFVIRPGVKSPVPLGEECKGMITVIGHSPIGGLYKDWANKFTVEIKPFAQYDRAVQMSFMMKSKRYRSTYGIAEQQPFFLMAVAGHVADLSDRKADCLSDQYAEQLNAISRRCLGPVRSAIRLARLRQPIGVKREKRRDAGEFLSLGLKCKPARSYQLPTGSDHRRP